MNGGISVYPSEGETFYTGINKYYLNKKYIKSVENILSTVITDGSVDDWSLVYNSGTGINPIPPQFTPVTSVDMVYTWNGATKTPFIVNVDYMMDSNNTNIVWISGGSHPAELFMLI